MRDILFRAKVKETNEWVYGFLCTPTSINVHIKDKSIGFESFDEWEIIPETIGQYTGLKDKTGNLIYEGDIYIAERGFMPSRGHLRKGYPKIIKVICVVEWSTYDAGWRPHEIGPINEHKEFDKNTPYHYYHTLLGGAQTGEADWIEIIGNIHDNPELLK